jgi:hypothetical protein
MLLYTLLLQIYFLSTTLDIPAILDGQFCSVLVFKDSFMSEFDPLLMC